MLVKCILNAKLLKLIFIFLLCFGIKNSIKGVLKSLLSFVSCKPTFTVLYNVFLDMPLTEQCLSF
jgi:hypothetical protein